MTGRNASLIADLRSTAGKSPAVKRLLSLFGKQQAVLTTSSLEARALVVAALHEHSRRRLAVVVPGDNSLRDFEMALRLFHRNPACVFTYPAPPLSPYHDVPPNLAIMRDEIRAQGNLLTGGVDLLIIPARSLFRRLPRGEDFIARTPRLRKDEDLDLTQLLEALVDNGYVRTDLVGEMGEFAFRGGILDIFPPNSDQPLRIELFGDTVESIRYFDPESQRSGDEVPAFDLYPASQFPLGRTMRHTVARALSRDFNDPHYRRDLAEKIEQLQEGAHVPALEGLIPAAIDTVSLPDIVLGGEEPWSLLVVEPDEVSATIDKYAEMLEAEYRTAADRGQAVYAPDRILTPVPIIRAFLDASALDLESLHVVREGREEIRLPSAPPKRYVNRLGELASDLVEGHNRGETQLFLASTKGGLEKTERLLTEFSIPFAADAPALSREITLASGELAQGFTLDDINVRVLSEWDLFEPPTSAARPLRRKKATETFLTDLRDLKPGDYIVHLDHGVGRFRGLQRIAFGENEREVMELEYANGGKLLLPMESLNLVQKYSAGEDAQPKLDRLGGTTWATTKARVKKAMRDMADELLKLYATRQMIPGHAFASDSPWQLDFEEAFEYDETDDQLAAIDDIKRDMESRRPMDRLLCGDVGYGKTEVAMRAAFKAVLDGKQIAVLAPTTILAYQHYRTFLRRFASFPVAIELMTRFRSPKEQKEVVAKVESGEIDVLIGTHRILGKALKFKDLGLVIIDEEQRFGVAQKERLKQMKKAVDVLAMSATPIPRTLHMSLVGIRDISVIETPPKDRLAIQTAVVPFDDQFIREAISFELTRGGQVFFVHNRVESIYAMKEYLEKLLPGLRVVVGHGQMDEQELEKAMLAFIGREYDVLLATTIIENGIDIPAANTIIINHAERFGLSQLYQLRGRVGRSDRLAFCYLIVPSDRVLTSDARKRLTAIQEFSDLGAGFRIAARDLEIRGSGNLLGGEQSGQIAAVGFEMYCKLLEETVREMKGEKVEEEIETTMNLGLDIYIPHHFIDDENLRMMFYKRIASARDEQRLEEIRAEMRDRFGALPPNVENLLEFVRLKRMAQQMGVVSAVRDKESVAVKFLPDAKVDPARLMALLEAQPEARFLPSGVLQHPLRGDARTVLESLRDLLAGISRPA